MKIAKQTKPRISRKMVRDYLRNGGTKRFSVSDRYKFLDTLCRRTGSCLGPVKPCWLEDLCEVATNLIVSNKGKFTSKDLLKAYSSYTYRIYGKGAGGL